MQYKDDLVVDNLFSFIINLSGKYVSARDEYH